MSNQPIKRWIHRVIIGTAMLICAALLPPIIQSQETEGNTADLQPMIVSARRGDTPASIARHYLNDASKGWMIVEYNGIEELSGGEMILVPMAPFRSGGLTPDGYQTVPVLAYSDIGSDFGDAPGRKQPVTWSAFYDQMHWLKTEGFTAITPAQLAEFMDFSGQLPFQSVLITVDTESQAFYYLGVPIMKELGLTATVFVATESVGDEGAMTWDQIKQLHEDGFTIACRGRSGRSLTRQKMGPAYEAYFKSVESELRLARKEIEAHLGAPCLFLAYPQGSTNSLVSAMAAKLGFSAAFTLSPGDNPFFADRFGIHRTAIDSRIDLKQYGKILTTLITADLN